MSLHRGDVVLVDWPYSDRTGSKVRPAVVVQDDVYNQLIDDTVLVLISRTLRAPGATEVEIDPAIERSCGLRYKSVASCANLLTIDQTLIIQTLGTLSAATVHKIDDAVKTALGLP